MRRLARAAVGFALAGCGSSLESPPAPAIALDVASSDLEVAQGTAQLIAVNVARSGGFDGDVGLSVDGTGPGLRAVVAFPETADGITDAMLAVAADTNFPTGAYRLIMRASGPGVPDAVDSLRVVVDPAGTPVYALQMRPIVVTLGLPVTVFVNIDRSNALNREIDLGSEEVPAQIRVSITPVANYKALAYMTVTADSHATPGRYQILVRGVSAGLADRLTRVPVTIRAAQ